MEKDGVSKKILPQSISLRDIFWDTLQVSFSEIFNVTLKIYLYYYLLKIYRVISIPPWISNEGYNDPKQPLIYNDLLHRG